MFTLLRERLAFGETVPSNSPPIFFWYEFCHHTKNTHSPDMFSKIMDAVEVTIKMADTEKPACLRQAHTFSEAVRTSYTSYSLLSQLFVLLYFKIFKICYWNFNQFMHG